MKLSYDAEIDLLYIYTLEILSVDTCELEI